MSGNGARSVAAAGADIPALGLGTADLVGAQAHAQVLRALELGYRHVDTAQCYGNEPEVGAAVRVSGIPRDEIFVRTKIWIDRFAEGDLERSVEESAQRLGFAPDLALLHWPNPSFPLAGTVRALCRARRSGLVRHVGLSNFPMGEMERALALADEPLVVNEVEFHPFLAQRSLLAALAKRKMALIAHTPLARGRVVRTAELIAIATRHKRTPAQVALRWLLQQPGVIAIPGSTREEHLQENLAVFDFSLSTDEMEEISCLASPAGRILDWSELVPRWDSDAP